MTPRIQYMKKKHDKSVFFSSYLKSLANYLISELDHLHMYGAPKETILLSKYKCDFFWNI